jgi:CDP-6-deoxy-D-xylo-4-hexulose-3-dehydrase
MIYRVGGVLKNTDTVMNNLFMVGLYPGLSTEMLDYMIAKFDNYFQKYK